MLDPLCKFPPPPGATEPVTAMCVDDTPAGEVIYAGFANGHIRVYRASIQVVTRAALTLYCSMPRLVLHELLQ